MLQGKSQLGCCAVDAKMAGGMLVRQPEEREPPVVESDSRKVELAEGEGKGEGEGMEERRGP